MIIFLVLVFIVTMVSVLGVFMFLKMRPQKTFSMRAVGFLKSD